MRYTKLLVSLGIAMAMMAALVTPAGARGGWELQEILPDDGTWCEFAPGVETEYSVDDSTLPRFTRWRIRTWERRNGTVLGLVQVRVAPEDPGPVRYVKDDPAAAGPEVIYTTFRADQWVVQSADGELVNVRGWFLHVTTTPDGETIDRSFGIWRGVDDLGEPIAYDTGVCRA